MPRPLFRLPGTGQILGIETNHEGAALIRAEQGRNAPRVLDADFCSWQNDEERSRTLNRKVRETGRRRTPVVSALSSQSYQLLQVQAPNVKDSEMKMALGWQIKDLIDYPLQQTVLDYFPAPDSPGLGRMIYVVAADRDAVQEHIDLMHRARLKISSIGIPELALRNIVRAEANSEAGLALLHMERESGMVLIFKSGILYVARRLRSGLDHLLHAESREDAGGLLESEDRQSPVLESVLLDLQRTLDYFERNFRSQPVGTLLLDPRLGDVPELQNHLQQNLDLKVHLLDVQHWLGEGASYTEQGRFLLALGNALKVAEH